MFLLVRGGAFERALLHKTYASNDDRLTCFLHGTAKSALLLRIAAGISLAPLACQQLRFVLTTSQVYRLVLLPWVRVRD